MYFAYRTCRRFLRSDGLGFYFKMRNLHRLKSFVAIWIADIDSVLIEVMSSLAGVYFVITMAIVSTFMLLSDVNWSLGIRCYFILFLCTYVCEMMSWQ